MAKILKDGGIVNGYGPGDIIDYDNELSTPVKNIGLEYVVYQGVTPIKTCDTFEADVKYVQEEP